MTSAQAWLLFALVTAAIWLHSLHDWRDDDSAYSILMHVPDGPISRLPVPARAVCVSLILLMPAAGTAAIMALAAYMLMG